MDLRLLLTFTEPGPASAGGSTWQRVGSRQGPCQCSDPRSGRQSEGPPEPTDGQRTGLQQGERRSGVT